MNQFYVKNSGDYITQSDFRSFDVWCEWHDSEEIEYIKSQLESPELFEVLFLKPYEKGLECYYPLREDFTLPYREFMHVSCKAMISGKIELTGYVSLICNKVTSLTLWVEDNEIQFLRSDRLTAGEDNPGNVEFITKYFGLEDFNVIHYVTNYSDSHSNVINGKLQLTET